MRELGDELALVGAEVFELGRHPFGDCSACGGGFGVMGEPERFVENAFAAREGVLLRLRGAFGLSECAFVHAVRPAV